MASRLTARQQMDRQVAERDLMNAYLDAARLLNWTVMHISDSRRMVNRSGRMELVGDAECRGWPDIFACHAETGRSVAVEVKKELGKLTPAQDEWLTTLSLCGVETFVLRPSTFDEGVALLRRRELEKAG